MGTVVLDLTGGKIMLLTQLEREQVLYHQGVVYDIMAADTNRLY